MSLKSGDYFLFAIDLDKRPIGQGSFPDFHAVVVQPAGPEAIRWHIQNVGDGKYLIRFKNLEAKIKDGCVVLEPVLHPEPFLWNIIPENRAPPMPGVYGIFVPEASNEAWFANKGPPFVEAPVTIFDRALGIAFVPAPPGTD